MAGGWNWGVFKVPSNPSHPQLSDSLSSPPSCAQSGRPRRNSHQRKLDQQEESCQNLTDFAPARVPSALDIFTAYNETLQCSHECVRTPVPVYAEDTLHSPGDYKTTFNGNR